MTDILNKTISTIALLFISLSCTFSNRCEFNIGPNSNGPIPQVCPIRIVNPLVKGSIWLSPRTIITLNSKAENKESWDQISDLSYSDDQSAICALEPGQSTSPLYLRDFDLHIPKNSIIHGIEIELEGEASTNFIQFKQIQLTDQNGYEFGIDKSTTFSKSFLPVTSITGNGKMIFGSSKDKWEIINLNPSNLNSEQFGIKLQFTNTGNEHALIHLDHLKLIVHYTTEANICNYNSILFSVDPVPGAIRYHWTLPEKARIISSNPNDHLIIVNQQFLDPLGIHEICVQTESADGFSEPCCLSFTKGTCKTGNISNKVWHDENADGIQNEKEDGIPNTKVVLYDAITKKTLRQLNTKLDGSFLFDNLNSGYYYLKFFVHDQFTFSKVRQGIDSRINCDIDESNGAGTTESFYLSDGATRNDIACGMYKHSSIGDLVWEDSNVNGMQDTGERGLQGIKLYLTTSGGWISDSTITDQYGKYIFKEVIPGKYKIYIPPINGYTSTGYQQGNNSLEDNDLLSNGFTQYVDLISSKNYMDLDFGFVLSSKVSGMCWYDYGQDGIRDPNDRLMKDIQILLVDEFDAIIDSTKTNAEGRFLFPRIASNKKLRLFINSDNKYIFTIKDGSGYEHNDSDVDNMGRSDLFSLSKNDSMNIDAGLIFDCTAQTSSMKLNTLPVSCYNGNSFFVSAQHEVSPVIPVGYIIKYVLAYGPFQKIIEISDKPTFNIHTNGIFNIYQSIFADQPDDYNYFDLSFVNYGKTNMVDLSSNYLSKKLCVSINSRPLTFYLDNCIDVSGKVWMDDNENGKQDLSESGIPYVLSILSNQNNQILDSIKTNDLGNYQFKDLNPSIKYRIAIKPIENHHFTQPNGSVSDLDDSDVDQFGKSELLFLSPGTKAIIDAGMVSNHKGFLIADEFIGTDFNSGNNELTGREGNQDQSLALYPNPVHDNIQILIPANETFIEYSITNTADSKIMSGILDARHNSIEVKELHSGLYLFQWKSRITNGTLKLIKI